MAHGSFYFRCERRMVSIGEKIACIISLNSLE